ncbi:hypothetical protein GP486_001873 [Trichoglossum hirsutum]|uniref:Uncharacterized protein n=1 Tax=Trichoglossum hirsutum TaxID=265104 RepID=A0A9P8LFC1_9PEZI|nr:hypothetical protein GP486_001873 [Trichoglossum hirsutum]
MDEMIKYINSDGIVQAWHHLTSTYFDRNRPRIDPVVCVNVLTLFYRYGRGTQLSQTFQWVYQILYYRAYLDGTRYYCYPESFLYFLNRLIASSDSPELHRYLKPLLLERVLERIGASGDAMALAMRILVCKSMGIRNEVDARSLLALQCEDGGWELCWMFQHPSTKTKVGNRGLNTALAINAINAVKE